MKDNHSELHAQLLLDGGLSILMAEMFKGSLQSLPEAKVQHSQESCIRDDSEAPDPAAEVASLPLCSTKGKSAGKATIKDVVLVSPQGKRRRIGSTSKKG
eukprot:2973178-Prorocentrum_lima.AAC.1